MGSGGVAIAALPTVICLKVPFSDGLGGGGGLSRICEHYGAPSSDTLITPTIDFSPHLASPVGEGQILSVV